jgi:alpha-mannosidase
MHQRFRLTRIVLCALFVASIFISSLQLSAQTTKRIYLAPDDHTDLEWSADEATYRQAFLNMLDYYINQIDTNSNQPVQFQPKWNTDGTIWLRTYEQNRTPQQFQHLIDLIKAEKVTSPMNAVVPTYGGQSAEAILRGM